MDELQTMHLGTFAHYVANTTWRCLEADLWGIGAGLTDEVLHNVSFSHLRKRLHLWYKSAAAKRGGLKIYERSSFDFKCLGNRWRPELNGPKAAETGTLLRFTVDSLREHVGAVREGHFIDVWRSFS